MLDFSACGAKPVSLGPLGGEMSRLQTRVLAAATIVILVVIALLIYQGAVKRRERLLSEIEFPWGTSRAQVVGRLGKPDQELEGPEMTRYHLVPTDLACSKAAAKGLRYSPATESGGPYCVVYMDVNERVACVEHGLIAY